MPHKLTIRTTVDEDGHLPKTRRNQIASTLQLYTGSEVEITIGKPKRSTQANAYYWGVVLKEIQLACVEAGVTATNPETGEMHPITAEMLHRMMKDRYLQPEPVEIAGQPLTLGGSTTRLDSTEFFDYVERVRSDPFVLALGVDVPEPEGSYRSYNLAEPAF